MHARVCHMVMGALHPSDVRARRGNMMSAIERSSMQCEFSPLCSMVALVALVDGDCPRYRHPVSATLRAAWGQTWGAWLPLLIG